MINLDYEVRNYEDRFSRFLLLVDALGFGHTLKLSSRANRYRLKIWLGYFLPTLAMSPVACAEF